MCDRVALLGRHERVITVECWAAAVGTLLWVAARAFPFSTCPLRSGEREAGRRVHSDVLMMVMHLPAPLLARSLRCEHSWDRRPITHRSTPANRRQTSNPCIFWICF